MQPAELLNPQSGGDSAVPKAGQNDQIRPGRHESGSKKTFERPERLPLRVSVT
jgi:hypothetical protein